MSGEQLSASVDETNAMRAKLGLKPLGTSKSTTSSIDTNKEKDEKSQQVLVDEAAHAAAASRLAHARQQRMLSGGVHLNKSLAAKSGGGGGGGGAGGGDDEDEDDSPQAFIARQRLATKRVQEQAARVQKPSRPTDRYNSSDLAGVQVGHSADQFATGETRILTLADTEVLDDRGTGLNDAEDVLVDVHFAESDRRKFLHNESKRKRYDVYEAAESVSGARPLLDFYDERHAGSGSIRLDDAGGMDVSRLEREAAIERQLEAQRSGRVLYELSSLKDPVIASDTRAPEEIIASTFKKPRTKKKRTKERTAGVSTADLIAEINSSSGGGVDARGADRGSRAAREHVADEDTADVAEAAAIARAKREAYEAARGKAKRAASARLGAPGADDDDGAAAATTDNDAGAAGADDDDDNGDEQLYAALERARRTATAAPTDVAATILARQAKREADASSARGKGIVYTDTTQFISTLDAQVIDEDEDGGAAVRVKPERSVKAEVQAEPEVNDEPQPDMDMDVDDKAVAESNNNDNDADANASEDGGVTSVMGQQTSVAIGIGSALAMLRSQGDKANPDDIIVGRRTDERIKRTKDDINKPLDTGAPTAERARHAAAQSSRAVPASERRQFNFELKYTDDEGRELTTKEAYRHLSYKFHGIAPSANKREKYAKQREEELAARQVAENVEETALKLERLQKKKKTAGIELKHL